MKASIIAIGNELLNGEVIDSNSNYLQNELLSFAITTERVAVITDDENIIISEIKNTINRSDFIFITGGLGPTEDDLTRFAVAKALNKEVIQDLDELKVIEEKFKKFNYKMSDSNIKQSYFPEGAKILANPMGTASGFYYKENNSHIFVLPGVPSELKAIYQDEIKSFIETLFPEPILYEKLLVRTIGLGESSLDTLIKDKIINKHSVRWEIIAKTEGVFLKFYPLDSNNKNWKKLLIDDLQSEIGDIVYSFNNESLEEVIAKLLLENNYSLSTVESCTGGYISKSLTDLPGSSKYYHGSFITYTNELKMNLVDVDEKLLIEKGAVSIEVAESMAKGGKKALGTSISVAVTGIAGPDGGSEEKPVGTVCFAVIDQNDKIFSTKRRFNGSREDVRKRTVYYALNLVRLAVLNKLHH